MEIVSLELIFQYESAIKSLGYNGSVFKRPFLIGLETDAFHITKKLVRLLKALLGHASSIFVFDPTAAASHFYISHLLGDHSGKVRFGLEFENSTAGSHYDCVVLITPNGAKFAEQQIISAMAEKCLGEQLGKSLILQIGVNYL